MAKYDTARRRSSSPPRCGFMKHIFLMSIGFVFGVIGSNICDYNQIVSWVNEHLLTKQTPQQVVAVKKSVEIPKPKFEFYTLLTQENKNKSLAAHSGTQATQIRPQSEVIAVTEKNSTPVLSIDMAVPVSEEKMALQEEKVVATLKKAQLKDGYLVQLASFRRSQDAEKMKAKLSLKGVIVTVVPVTQQHTQWFRVVLGPFASKLDAEHAQRTLMHSERISGIVRRMDA